MQLELVDRHAGPDARGEDVDALGRAFDADDLPAEQPPVRAPTTSLTQIGPLPG